MGRKIVRKSEYRPKKSQNEQGIALIMVLLILIVISLLGMTIIGIALNNLKMSTSERTHQSAYYIAESGINLTLDRIYERVEYFKQQSRNDIDFYNAVKDEMNKLNKKPLDVKFEPSNGKEPRADVLISFINESNTAIKYKIISEGTIDNRSRRVSKEIDIKWEMENSEEWKTAVFVTDFIKLTGGAQIYGEAGTNASSAGSIELDGGAGISDTITVGPDSGKDVIKKPSWMTINNEVKYLSNKYTFDLPSFPIFPSNHTPPDKLAYKGSNSYKVIDKGNLNIDNYVVENYNLTMNQDMKFNQININSNYTLNIDVGNQDRNIVVDSLNVLNGKINIIGTGRLTFYVNNNINMGSGSVINVIKSINAPIPDHIKKLEIYYKGQSLEMSGAQKIYGSLHAQRANITLTAGSGFYGYVITGGDKLNISGGANAYTQLFYAPNAAVTLDGGGKVKGTIIAKSYTGAGGTSVTYNDEVKFPPNILPGGSDGDNTGLIIEYQTREE